VATGQLLRKYEEFPPRRAGELPLVAPFAISPDCRLVALGGEDGDLHVSEVATGKEISRLKGRVDDEMVHVSMSFSDDGKLLALGGVPGKIHIWDTRTGKELRLLRWQDMENSSLAFSPDGKLLAAGSRHGRIALWDVATGKRLRLVGGPQAFEPVHTIKFSGDAKVLASNTANSPFRLWDVATGKQLFELPADEVVFDMVFSRSGRLMASCGVADHIIRIREVSTGKQRRLEGHSDEVTFAAFSPDGKSLASASRDQTLRFWDVETLKQRFVQKLKSGQNESAGVIECLVWSPDGKILASAPGPDNKIHLWDPATGKEIVP
jgi:WD40 repeat protein